MTFEWIHEMSLTHLILILMVILVLIVLRGPDVGGVHAGSAALRASQQPRDRGEGPPRPPALPAPAGPGQGLQHHVQLLERGEGSHVTSDHYVNT